MGLFLLCPPTEHRGVIDDGPRATALHVRQHRPGHTEGAGQGHIQYPQPLFVAHLHHALLATQARVVDQHIDPAQRLFGRSHQGLDFVLECDIAQLAINCLQTGLGLEALHCVFQAPRMHVGNHQRATTFLGTAAGRRITDTGTGGGGNQHRLAGQQLMTGNIRGGLFHSVYLRRNQYAAVVRSGRCGHIVKMGYEGEER
ncbi:hypothetical protein D3C73_507900 [compost metagenome]